RPQHEAREAEHRVEIGGDDLAPLLVLHPQREVVARDAGVVHEDSGRAPLGDQRLDERFAGRCVGHVEHVAASGESGLLEGARDRLHAGCAGRGADDRGALARQLERDRPADSTRGAGHQRHLVEKLHACSPATAASAASSDAGSCTLEVASERSMRETSPVSTLPGPNSTTRVAPIAFSRWTTSTQRTGDDACRTSASRMRAGSDSTATSTLLSTGQRGARTSIAAGACASRSPAGRSSAEWNGAETGSGIARFAPAAFAYS